MENSGNSIIVFDMCGIARECVVYAVIRQWEYDFFFYALGFTTFINSLYISACKSYCS